MPGCDTPSLPHADAEPRCPLPIDKRASLGSTSEPQAGQWNTLSGSLRISGWPHSQGWAPRASGSPTISRKVSSVEPSSGNPQEPQRAMPAPKKASSADSQKGQVMWCALESVADETLMAVSFIGCRSVAWGCIFSSPLRHVLALPTPARDRDTRPHTHLRVPREQRNCLIGALHALAYHLKPPPSGLNPRGRRRARRLWGTGGAPCDRASLLLHPSAPATSPYWGSLRNVLAYIHSWHAQFARTPSPEPWRAICLRPLPSSGTDRAASQASFPRSVARR